MGGELGGFLVVIVSALAIVATLWFRRIVWR